MPYFKHQYVEKDEITKLWVGLIMLFVLVFLMQLNSCNSDRQLDRLEREHCDLVAAAEQWPSNVPKPAITEGC